MILNISKPSRNWRRLIDKLGRVSKENEIRDKKIDDIFDDFD